MLEVVQLMYLVEFLEESSKAEECLAVKLEWLTMSKHMVLKDTKIISYFHH